MPVRPWKEQVASAIDALTNQMVLMTAEQKMLREGVDKVNQAAILENLAATRLNDLVGLQSTQIRDLVRQVGDLEGRLNRHLDGMGYSE